MLPGPGCQAGTDLDADFLTKMRQASPFTAGKDSAAGGARISKMFGK